MSNKREEERDWEREGACVGRQGAAGRSRWQCVCNLRSAVYVCVHFNLYLFDCITHVSFVLVEIVYVLSVRHQGRQWGQRHCALPTLPPCDEDAPSCHCHHGYCSKRGADIVCLVCSCSIGEHGQLQLCHSTIYTSAWLQLGPFSTRKDLLWPLVLLAISKQCVIFLQNWFY